MISITIRFRASRKGDADLGRIVFRIIHQRKSREIASCYQIHCKEWDNQEQKIRYPLFYNKRYVELEKIETCLKEELTKLEAIVENISTRGNYTLDEVVMSYKLTKQKNSFYHFTHFLSKQLSKEGKKRTSKAYLTTCRRLIQFNKHRDFALNDINPLLVQSFEKHLKADHLEYNTISFYLRNLRAIYNKSILYKRISRSEDNPFAGTSTGVKQTKKKALSIADMSELMKYDLLEAFENKHTTDNKTDKPHFQQLSLAKDLFAFSFYSRGMSFVDIAFLKKENIKNGIISYHRRKTGQQLHITINTHLATIIKSYAVETRNSPYVFPIIKDQNLSPYHQYQSGLRKQNLLLKEIASLSKLNIKLSTHVARHSWATIAKKQNISIWEISESLGHSNIKTTYIYLGSFEQSKLDEANERVAFAVYSQLPLSISPRGGAANHNEFSAVC